MKCSICSQEIILIPSANERAKQYGLPASHFTALFTTHSSCFIKKRNEDTIELMRRNHVKQVPPITSTA